MRSRSSIDTSCTPSGRPPGWGTVMTAASSSGQRTPSPSHSCCERVGLALQRPQRDVGGDVDEIADLDGDAVDEGCRHPAIGGHPQSQLEAGDLAVLADVAEADGLDEVSLEEHGRRALWLGATAGPCRTAATRRRIITPYRPRYPNLSLSRISVCDERVSRSDAAVRARAPLSRPGPRERTGLQRRPGGPRVAGSAIRAIRPGAALR